MKNISDTQQFRRATGEFLMKQDTVQENARQQQERIQQLAKYPGRTTQNANQQDVAHAMLNLVTLLSAIRSTPEPINTAAAMSDKNIIGIETHSPPKPHVATPGLREQGMANKVSFSALLRPHNQQQNITQNTFSRPRREAPQQTSLYTQPLAPAHINQQQATAALFDEQNKLLDSLLADNQRSPDSAHKLDRVNSLVAYLEENLDTRIEEVARLLLSASGSYGGRSDERISKSMQWGAITDYLNYSIFSMTFNEWCLQQMEHMRAFENHLYHQDNLQRKYTNVINFMADGAALTPATRKFYQQHILSRSLPTFLLHPTAEEGAELANMGINEVQWGLIYAGTKLLSYSGANYDAMSLGELAEVGITLDTLLRQGVVPQEYVDFFFLPALFHHAYNGREVTDDPALIDAEVEQIIKRYFEHTDKWIKHHNPVTLLPELIQNWKTRPELAREILREKDVPQSFLNQYLDRHAETIFRVSKDHSALVPNVDEVFDQQNQKIARVAYESDKLVLPHAFNNLSPESQDFILNSTINRVSARFDAAHTLRGIPLGKSAKMGIEQSGALVYPVPDKYDILQCLKDDEERFFIMNTRKNGEYLLYSADPLRRDLLWLLDDIPVGDMEDYDLKIAFDRRLKSQAEPAEKLINQLARLHSNKLRLALNEQGFQKTLNEKAIDFLYSLIPFYTCITESMKGNSEEAVPACIMDIIGILPFAGTAANTSLRFGTALAKSTALALHWGARQATLKNMLRQAGRIYLNQFPTIAAEVSPQVIRKLSISFLRSMDPGIELFARGAIKGTEALANVIANMKEKGRGLAALATSLRSSSSALQPEIETQDYVTRTLFSEVHGRELELAAIGQQNGRQVWAQIHSESKEPFGMKYFINAQDKLEPIPSPLAKRLKLLKTEGLGGKGAIKKNLFSDDAKAGPSNQQPEYSEEAVERNIEGVAMKTWIFGDPSSEKLLYPEINKLRLRTTYLNLRRYELAINSLSPGEREALRTWVANDAFKTAAGDPRSGIIESANDDLNERIINSQPITEGELNFYENVVRVVVNRKLPAMGGDFLYVHPYLIGSANPWLDYALRPGDIVTSPMAVIPLSADPALATNTVYNSLSSVDDIDTFLFYKIENAQNVIPLRPASLGLSDTETQYLYPPGTLLKIKSISISQTALPDEVPAHKEIYKPSRIGVILTEVSAKEANEMKNLRNIFTGESIKLVDSTPQKLEHNKFPPPAGKYKYWNRVRESITAPFPPDSSAVAHHNIQKLKEFIPELPLKVSSDVQAVTRLLEEYTQSIYKNRPWYAYAGLKGDAPPAINLLREIVRSRCDESLRKVTHVSDKLADIIDQDIMQTEIGSYIRTLTPTDDPEVVNEVYQRLINIYDRARLFLEAAKSVDYSNFVIVSSDLIEAPTSHHGYISLLDDEGIDSLSEACTQVSDPESRITIIADRFFGNSPDPTRINFNFNPDDEERLSQVITHETTHLSSLTSDLFIHVKEKAEIQYNAMLARESLMRNLIPVVPGDTMAAIWNKQDFYDFMQDLVNYQNINQNINYASVIKTILNDRMLFANLLYSDAETLAMIADDIDAGRSYEGTTRMRRSALPGSEKRPQNDSDALAWLPFFLNVATPGLLDLQTTKPNITPKHISPDQLTQVEKNGVTMQLQLYGDTARVASLFPESYAWQLNEPLLTDKVQENIMRSLSPDEKVALTSWSEFADQHLFISEEMHNKVNINKKLIKDIPLSQPEQFIYNNTVQAINRRKLVGVSGDYLRVNHYSADENNPWLTDEMDINDYLTSANAFLSVSAGNRFMEHEIAYAGNPENNIASLVFYKIENGTRALPVLPLPGARENTNSEYLYPPGTLFKVKDVAVSVPVSTKASDLDVGLYQPQRVAVTLTEVDAAQAPTITTRKNIFDGTVTHFLKPRALSKT